MNMSDTALAWADIPDQGVASMHDIHALEAIHPSPTGPVNNTYDLLRRGSRKKPESPATSFFLRTEDFRRPFVWTHRQWIAKITQTANMFRRLGVQRRDVIAFILPNLPETHWVIWGGEAAGIVFAINPLLEPALMAELMNTAKPKVLVTLAPTPGTDIWHKAAQAAGDVKSLEHVLTVSPLTYLRGPAGVALRVAGNWRTPNRIGQAAVSGLRGQMRREASDSLTFPEPTLDDVASYFCTGGTTGRPKIAVRTHRTEVANAMELAATFGPALQGDDKAAFCGLPLFHVNAQIGTGLTIWALGSQVVLGTPQGYRAPGLLQHFWDIAEHHRFTTFSGVPTVYSALLQHSPAGKRLDALKYGICGAAPMPPELLQRFQRETGIKILEGYGLTEGGCVSSINPPLGETRAGSIGLRLPWQDMRTVIIDSDGQYVRDAQMDETGLIIIRGPNLFRGYLHESHNKGIWIERPSGQGMRETWLNTGDLGRMDSDGYFWLTGRKKELIIRGGHNIDPKMIEDAMHGHPSVALAAAVGKPDAHAGEVPVLYVQLRTGASATPEELLSFAQRFIAERAAWPKDVKVLPTLPTTAVGKIFKPALTHLEMEATLRDEAQASGARVEHCEIVNDATRGTVLRWSASGNVPALQERLQRYTFAQEQIPRVSN